MCKEMLLLLSMTDRLDPKNNRIDMSNEDILNFAKDKTAQNWGMAVVASLLMGLTSFAISMVPFYIGTILCGGALQLGYSLWALRRIRRDEFEVEELFAGFVAEYRTKSDTDPQKFFDEIVSYHARLIGAE